MYTRTNWFTPGDNVSSPSSRLNTFTSRTIPPAPLGTRNEVSLTSRAFSPKIACNNLSSAVNSVTPLGVTLPTKISPSFQLLHQYKRYHDRLSS